MRFFRHILIIGSCETKWQCGKARNLTGTNAELSLLICEFMKADPIIYERSMIAPAKVNLMLSIHGPRGDGFHELSSVICALNFGDELRIAPCEETDQLVCSDPRVPLGQDNLILRAADAFRARTKLKAHYAFYLDKRIPMGAGLGGGSSDAVAALKLMNQTSGNPLKREDLIELSAELGSDCPFFVSAQPSIMRGRGERIDVLDASLISRLRGQRLVLFQPEFPIETAWAYRRLRELGPEFYETESLCHARLEQFKGGGTLTELLMNSFEPVVGMKYLSMTTLLNGLRALDIPCLMSGSGSGCFALLDSDVAKTMEIKGFVQEAWGKFVFWVETSIC